MTKRSIVRVDAGYMQVAFAKVAMSEFAQKDRAAPFCPGKVQHWP